MEHFFCSRLLDSCFFGLTPFSWLLIFAFIVAVVGLGFIFINSGKHEESNTVGQLSGKPYRREEDSDPKPGDAFLYDEIDGLKCNFVVTRFDEENNRVFGYFEAQIPAGSEALGVHYDQDNQDVWAQYRLNGEVTELSFNVYDDPDELRDYDIRVSYPKTKHLSA